MAGVTSCQCDERARSWAPYSLSLAWLPAWLAELAQVNQPLVTPPIDNTSTMTTCGATSVPEQAVHSFYPFLAGLQAAANKMPANS
ncbi:hypothetical protein HaLaN_09053, partial [Haematococcus lacustris]